jgi:hypothetical protein
MFLLMRNAFHTGGHRRQSGCFSPLIIKALPPRKYREFGSRRAQVGTLGKVEVRTLNLKRVLVVLALMLLALWVAGPALADGTGGDPVLTMGGGHGSPPCFGPGGVSFQGSTGPGPTFLQQCNNNGTTDLTQFSFDILAANAPGGITPMLDGLLAPFANNPLLSPLDWTVSCASSTTPAGTVDACTAMQSSTVTEGEAAICSTFFGSFCSKLASLSATQMENLDPLAFVPFNNDPCEDPFVYVIFGVIPGCDASASGLSGGEGGFVQNASFDLVPGNETPAPLPEPGSFALLLAGLSGLPLLRRKFAR